MIHQKVPITDRKIRFALAGCGRISSNHMDALKKHSDRAELVAVCDVDEDALRQAAKRTGAQPFTKFFRDAGKHGSRCHRPGDAQRVACGPSDSSAAAGRHVMTEKPMATRWNDGKRMVSACDAAGVRFSSSSKTGAIQRFNC